MRAVITVPAITVPITVPEDSLSKGSGCLTAHIYFIVLPPPFHLFYYLRTIFVDVSIFCTFL